MVRSPALATSRIVALFLALSILAGPACAARVPQARLIHCGRDTCLRISGYRQRAAMAVRIDGREIPVEGGRAWRVTVPLATARAWAISPGYSLALTLADAQDGTESTSAVILPPGALGRPVELAMMVVRPH